MICGCSRSAWFCVCICRLSLCNSRVFGTDRSRVQGARFTRGGGKSFLRLKRFCSADPGYERGPFWNVKKKGKAAGVSGASSRRGSKRRPAHLSARGVGARHTTLRRPLRPASLPAQNREASLNPRGLLNVYRKRGGNGDSILQDRSSLLLAAPMRSAHSVSLIRLAAWSSWANARLAFGTAPPGSAI